MVRLPFWVRREQDVNPGIRRLVIRLAGNSGAQRALDWTVRAAQYRMGIGSGSSPAASGQAAVLRLIKHRRAEGPRCVFDVEPMRVNSCSCFGVHWATRNS
jgi:hypothetical protein